VGRVKQFMAVVGVVAALAVSVFAGFAGADSTTFTLQCGTNTYTVTKPNESAAVYTNGTLNFVTDVGADIGSGTATPNALLCTINGEGPFAFIITPAS
jgi:hypothetical protein